MVVGISVIFLQDIELDYGLARTITRHGKTPGIRWYSENGNEGEFKGSSESSMPAIFPYQRNTAHAVFLSAYVLYVQCFLYMCSNGQRCTLELYVRIYGNNGTQKVYGLVITMSEFCLVGDKVSIDRGSSSKRVQIHLSIGMLHNTLLPLDI